MSDWQDKSDFEINKSVALAQDEDGDVEKITQRESMVKSISSIALIKFKGYASLEKFNPCNNPSDAWPIILENDIIIEPRKSNTSLAYIKGDAPNEDKNPLRAAMIVYLEMNGVKPNE